MIIAKYDIQDEVIIEIGKFALLWNDFENRFLSNGDYKKLPTECEKIIIRNQTSCEEFRCYLCSVREQCAIQDGFYDDFLFPQKSNRKIKDNEKEAIRAFLEMPLESDKQLYGCLLIIKRYRDNLMHGIKDINLLEEQKSAFEIINEILESLEYR